MTFDILSTATTVGQQKAHLSLLNSNISKLIHDQGKLTEVTEDNRLPPFHLKVKPPFVGHSQYQQCCAKVSKLFSKHFQLLQMF